MSIIQIFVSFDIFALVFLILALKSLGNEKIITNREIFLPVKVIEKFPEMLFVHNHIGLSTQWIPNVVRVFFVITIH